VTNQNRAAAAAEFVELGETLVGERLVTDGQYFIDEQDIGDRR
jgi:hypothetical protein